MTKRVDPKELRKAWAEIGLDGDSVAHILDISPDAFTGYLRGTRNCPIRVFYAVKYLALCKRLNITVL